ncbi:hypothetical protein DXG01_007053 [Tephrocybe rancida]|nr:hypothetical protein DXG01_007053 [Tephrocybe rancida]
MAASRCLHLALAPCTPDLSTTSSKSPMAVFQCLYLALTPHMPNLSTTSLKHKYVTVTMGYKPVDMSTVPDYIKDFCQKSRFFLLEEPGIDSAPNGPSKRSTPGQAEHTAIPATPAPSINTPLGKLNNPSFSTFNKSTPPSTFTAPAPITPIGRLDDASFTPFNECTPHSSFNVAPLVDHKVGGGEVDSFTLFQLQDTLPADARSIAKKPVTLPCVVSVSSDKGSTDWECKYSIDQSGTGGTLPSSAGVQAWVGISSSVAGDTDVTLSASTETRSWSDVPLALCWYVIYVGRAPGVFQEYNTVTNNTLGVTGN